MKVFQSMRFPVFLLVLMLASCKSKKEEAPPTLAEVNTIAAGQKTVPVFSEYVGETYGLEDVQIQSRVDGWVTSIHFKEGDLIQKGQLLYTIDDLPIKNKLDQSEAALAEAITMKVKNKSELDRVEPLTAMHALSQRDLDAAKANYQASISQVAAAEAALRNAKIELSYTKITAPITGVIGISKVLVGDYIARLNTGAPLNTISSINTMRIRFSISEDEYLSFMKKKILNGNKAIDEKLPVQLLLSDGSAFSEMGNLNLANRQIDPATGSLLIQALFSNPQNILKPGQYVKVRIQTDIFENAVLVPQQTVNQLQNIFQVFIVNDSNKITPVIVEPGQRVGSNWIIKKGLQLGDKVAILGSVMIKPNQTIKPNPINWNYDSTSKN